jgi:protein-serine/threonine kinase
MGEDTKAASEDSRDEVPIVDIEEDLTDSFFGSTSEGGDSILIQKVPHLECLQGQTNNFSVQDKSLSALKSAVSSNNLEICKDYLRTEHPDPNTQFENNETLLHIAARLGHSKICEALIDYGEGTNVNSFNSKLSTPLHLACENGHLPAAQLLVRSGADINKKDLEGNTPLHLASISNNPLLVSWLLTRNPDTTMKNLKGLKAEECGTELVQKAFIKHFKRTLVSEGPAFTNVHKMNIYRSKTVDYSSRIAPSHFSVLRELGKGSFGEVFLVSKQETTELFAMKVLQKEKIMNQNLIKYAITERNVLSYLSHPFIVSLKYAFQTQEKLFLILDFCAGGDLGQHLTNEKRFTEYRARLYLCEIVLALEELHKRNIIFRDLKPDNIVIDHDGHARLTDFGLSKEHVCDNYQARSFCGSLAYLAPEIIRRNGHGKAVDWYLLGVVFYEMVVGSPPYFSYDKKELIHNIQKGKLKIPSTLSAEARELICDVPIM